jgi:hypothetical protein
VDTLVVALGPAFAAGFALQRLLEILDPIVDRLTGSASKKIVINVIAFAVGLGLALAASLRVLEPLGITDKDAVDVIVTGLVVSGGTEGFNSIMKFLGYKKEEKKEESKQKAGTTESLPVG